MVLVVTLQQRDARRQLRHSRLELATAERMAQDSADLMSGLRGYLLTDKQRERARARAQLAGFGPRSARLVALGDAPAQRALARRIQTEGAAYIRDFARPITRMRREDHRASAAWASTAVGERRMDAVRASLARFIAVERRTVVAREHRVDAAERRSVAAATGGVAGSIALILLISAYLRGAIVRPIRRVAAMARRLAAGDLDSRMPVSGAGEVGELEQAFNTMATSLEARRDELRGVAAEQAALRRVATLVAAGGSPEDIFEVVSDEVRALIGIEVTSMFRCEHDGMLTLVALRSASGSVLEEAIGGRIRMGRGFRALLESGGPRRLDAAEVARWAVEIPGAAGLGLRASIGGPIIVAGEPWGAIFASSTDPDGLPPDAEARFAGFAELVGTAVANAQAQSEMRLLADDQAALRRVATLVARESSSAEVFAAVAEEVGRLLHVEDAAMLRYEDDGAATVVADWAMGEPVLRVGTRLSVEGDNVTGKVLRTGRPARIDDYANATGSLGTYVRSRGIRAAVGSPIVVDGRLWGAMVAATAQGEPMPADAASRIEDFTELVAIAVAEAAARAELAASNERLMESRARVVAAADEERARVVRDLHDGAQQRIVHALITLRMARSASAAGEERATGYLDEAINQAERAHVELRELAQGIMPSVLTHGGLAAAVRSLVGSLPLRVSVDVVADRLPHDVEANAYFIIAEALTNVLKHARADSAHVRAAISHGALSVEVRDDGVGGARLNGSTGLVGLQDRAVAVAGTLRVDSPAGGGTRIEATLPLGAHQPPRTA